MKQDTGDLSPGRPAAHKATVRQPGATLKVGSEYYVLASSLSTHRETRVLADGHSFAVFDAGGDILESPLESLGLFHRDTRYLSRFELSIGGKSPCLLNSYLSDDNAQLRINLANPDLHTRAGVISLARDSVQIERSWVLAGAALIHRVVVRSYANLAVRMPFEIHFGADFADLFEVRGVKRVHHGKFLEPVLDESRVEFQYHGLDEVTRTAEIVFNPGPQHLHNRGASFMLELAPGETVEFEARITCGLGAGADGRSVQVPITFETALTSRRDEIAKRRSGWATITTSSELLNSLIQRSQADLTSIISESGDGAFMMAGIPWFATLFGRDSLITALSVLPFNPGIAGRTLRMLARTQGARVDDARDEQPGKIVHELRWGEMAATGEVPFGRYYGTVDATPLYLWLMGEYCDATAGLELANELWPNVEHALEWIERCGDRDCDGYVEYFREIPSGLANQGWKDSFDAISHADGTLARAPIALAEVQGYVFAAYESLARAAARLGRGAVADQMRERAAALKANFIRDFWVERLDTVALALDRDKQQCQVVASNGAHCLAAGIVDGERAAVMAKRLLRDDAFSGWGVRTLGANEKRYNPMSYHNGSVWPHDNAIAAMGLVRAGNPNGAFAILEGLLQAGLHLKTGSLPELFCGFVREPRLGPVPYPVACHPQAWSAASVFMVMRSILGIRVAGAERRVRLKSPALPVWLDWVRVEGLKVGGESLSLQFTRAGNGVTVELLESSDSSIGIEVS